ncbi:MAG: ABC transporter permease [Marivirga sp.]|nr:ABC transporter permease [Marivirga sp.]
MISNYLKVAWRNILRNRAYACINIAGLTLGLTISIVLFWIVRFEYGFDVYHHNAGRLYQVKMHDKFGEPQSHVPQGVIKALNEQIQGVERAVSVLRWDPSVIRIGNNNLQLENTYFIHPEFLEMIDVEWIAGSPQKSLSGLYQVVLDEPTAKNLFQDEDPLGKVIRYDNAADVVVSGIIREMPLQSDFQFKMIMSNETLKKLQGNYAWEDNWGGGDSWFHGYVLVKKSGDVKTIEEQLTGLLTKRKDETNYVRAELSAFSNLHFDVKSDAFNYVIPRWMVNVLLIIAVFLICIASINFVNLAIAQATYRSREIGVRKVMGSGRASIILQFFIETGVLVTLSVLLASVMATQLVAYADNFFNTKIDQMNIWGIDMVLYLLVLVICITILAGFYPAFLLSGLKPVKIFRNQIPVLSGKGVSLRKSLIVAQFVIAQVMVICMLVGTQQMRFFYNTDMGFARDSIITVNMAYKDSVLLQERFQRQLLKYPEIKEVTYGLTSPSSNRNWWWGDTKHPGLLNGEQSFRLQWIDDNYLQFYDIDLVAGRNFVHNDTARYALINEKAVSAMGFNNPEDALGETLFFWGNNKVTVIGVVKNYYSQGLKSEVPPHLYMFGNWNYQLAQIKIDVSKIQTAVEHIRQSWTELHPNHFFDYELLSESLKTFYEDERKLSNFIILFAVVGITIGCLGLFGLVSFVCARRTKEISIRKVLGATLANIISLLSRDFILLVLVAFVIAIPIGWIVMDKFLQQYTYHTSIHWSVFAIAGFATGLLALVTVGLKSLGTALLNPAESLKYE